MTTILLPWDIWEAKRQAIFIRVDEKILLIEKSIIWEF